MRQPKQTLATGHRMKHRKWAHCVKNEKRKRRSSPAAGERSACAARRAHSCPGHTQDLATVVSQTRNIPGQLKWPVKPARTNVDRALSARAGAPGGAQGPARLHRGRRAVWQRCPPHRRGSGTSTQCQHRRRLQHPHASV